MKENLLFSWIPEATGFAQNSENCEHVDLIFQSADLKIDPTITINSADHRGRYKRDE